MKIKGTNKAAAVKMGTLMKYGLVSTDAYAIKKGKTIEVDMDITALVTVGFVEVLNKPDKPKKKTIPLKRGLIDNEDKEIDDKNVRDN